MTKKNGTHCIKNFGDYDGWEWVKHQQNKTSCNPGGPPRVQRRAVETEGEKVAVAEPGNSFTVLLFVLVHVVKPRINQPIWGEGFIEPICGDLGNGLFLF